MPENKCLTFGACLPDVTYVDRPGAYGLIRDDQGRFAVCIDKSDGVFLPGGGIDAGESPEEALAREVGEELGQACVVGAFVGTAAQYCLSDAEGGFLKTGHFFEGTLGAALGTKPEHTIRWVTRREAIRELREDSHRWAVTQIEPDEPDE